VAVGGTVPLVILADGASLLDVAVGALLWVATFVAVWVAWRRLNRPTSTPLGRSWWIWALGGALGISLANGSTLGRLAFCGVVGGFLASAVVRWATS
jgi:hypothetical protein